MKTTVSLDSDLRDRLAASAARHNRTMAEEIEALLEAADEREFWVNVQRGYAVGDVMIDDDYPEYAHLSVGKIPAEGAHNT
jgi:hypothetical protein